MASKSPYFIRATTLQCTMLVYIAAILACLSLFRCDPNANYSSGKVTPLQPRTLAEDIERKAVDALLGWRFVWTDLPEGATFYPVTTGHIPLTYYDDGSYMTGASYDNDPWFLLAKSRGMTIVNIVGCELPADYERKDKGSPNIQTKRFRVVYGYNPSLDPRNAEPKE